MYTRSLFIAFILIRSPNRAPPVFLLDGSTEIIPKVLFSKSIKNLLTNSSTKDDLPEPPVPVIPSTGILVDLFCECILSKDSFATSGKFSAEEINLAMADAFLLSNFLTCPFSC